MKISTMTATGKTWFCENWPLAKTVLQFIQVNPKNMLIRLAATILIAAGDAAQEKICPSLKQVK